MSLVGSLEDLGLGDILQIISLSRKSGVLELRGEDAEGQIVFSEGAISSAHVQGGATDLAELLGRSRSLAGPPLEEAIRQARSEERDLESVVIERGLSTAQDLDGLRRDHVESTVLKMFTWPTGEFSFAICDRPTDAAGDLEVSPGVNPQFLALEGTRVSDECARGRSEDASDDVAGLDLDAAFGPDAVFEGSASASGELADAPVAPGPAAPGPAAPEPELLEPELLEVPAAVEVAAIAAAEPLLEAEPLEAAPVLDAVEPLAAIDPAPAAAPGVTPAPVAAPEATPAAQAPKAAPAVLPPIVVVDSDIQCLEWIKAALEGLAPTIHVFQRTDHGMNRIRQYLARSQRPLLVLAADAPADALSGARDVQEMVKRLKAQAARMPILLLDEEGSGESPPKGVDGVLHKPNPTHLSDPRRAQQRQILAERLRGQVHQQIVTTQATASAAGAASGDLSKETLARLKGVTDRLRARAGSGETLGIVMEFARESFARVALFMVRGDEVHGMAQLGLEAAGGPDDAGLRKLRLPARESAWIRAVLDERKPVRCAAHDPGDQRLAVLLGDAVPEEAWVAPLTSGEQVVALLYGDNLPAGELIGDTAALEVVLQQAGLVLDLACLERILEQGEGA